MGRLRCGEPRVLAHQVATQLNQVAMAGVAPRDLNNIETCLLEDRILEEITCNI
jgi:hypothetical protein